MQSPGTAESSACPETTEKVKDRIGFIGTSEESSQMVSASGTGSTMKHWSGKDNNIVKIVSL